MVGLLVLLLAAALLAGLDEDLEVDEDDVIEDRLPDFAREARVQHVDEDLDLLLHLLEHRFQLDLEQVLLLELQLEDFEDVVQDPVEGPVRELDELALQVRLVVVLLERLAVETALVQEAFLVLVNELRRGAKGRGNK